MPSLRRDQNNSSHPWQARVQHQGRRVSLGYHKTHADALDVERKYREEHQIRDLSHRARSSESFIRNGETPNVALG